MEHESQERIICPECKKITWSTIIRGNMWQCRTCLYIKEENIWIDSAKKWDQTKGSKKEQGILTHSQPKRKECGCDYINKKLNKLCQAHYFGWQLALQEQKKIQNKVMEEEKKEEQPQEKPASSPWVEKTRTEENIQIGIVTPNE